MFNIIDENIDSKVRDDDTLDNCQMYYCGYDLHYGSQGTADKVEEDIEVKYKNYEELCLDEKHRVDFFLFSSKKIESFF